MITILKSEVYAVLNLEKGDLNAEFLERAEAESKIVRLTREKPKSLVLCDGQAEIAYACKKSTTSIGSKLGGLFLNI